MKEFNSTIFKPQQQRFTLALAASIAVHLLLAVFIVAAEWDKPLPKKEQPHIMDVVLLDDDKKPSKKANRDPIKAEKASTRSGLGSKGEHEDFQRKKSPLKGLVKNSTSPKPTPAPKPQRKKTPPPTKSRIPVIAKRGNEPNSNPEKPPLKRIQKKRHKKDIINKPAAPNIPFANLMPSAMALSQLSQDFQRERRLKQNLGREADIPINTRQAKYAPYMQSMKQGLEAQWRPELRKIDYDKYSDIQRRSLIKLTINKDGSIGGVEIRRSSLVTEINKSAIEAIYAAGPYKPIPSSWGLDRMSIYISFEVVKDGFVFRTM